MSWIPVLPEFGLGCDVFSGFVTAQGESLAPIIKEVDKLDKVADDIVNMLSGEGILLASFPNREKSLLYAGGITAMWYGLAIGLAVAGIIAIAVM
ncbi:MAG: tetrahydromethanopterin S-methyltransferase subunit B [Methanomicrobiales archaeon]|jgi:tetrahydromethanopterin S-methyltransferase subunit B|nr:tetrahydromethanopterin S-methyltransferase subunit B [Methanomicrobiales archaeon]